EPAKGPIAAAVREFRGRGGTLSQGLEHRGGAGGHALGIACRREPRPATPRTGPLRRSPRRPRADLRLVYRGLRHRRSDRGESTAGLTDLSRAGSVTKGLLQMTAPRAARPGTGAGMKVDFGSRTAI